MSWTPEERQALWDAHAAWEKGLRDKYPGLFKDYLRGRTFEVGKGWYSIIEGTLELMYWIQEKCPGDKVNVGQIKEKFGELRMYIDTEGSDLFDRIMQLLAGDAEMKSCRTCEACGKPGKRRDGGYIQTLCDEHGPPTKAEDES